MEEPRSDEKVGLTGEEWAELVAEAAADAEEMRLDRLWAGLREGF